MEIQVSPLRRNPVQLYIDFLEDYLPDPFVIAIGVTIVVAVLAACIAPHGTAATIIVSWYNGLFGILPFAIQMILILVTGHALANTPLVTRGLTRLVAFCRTPNQAMVMTFLVTCAGSWINWGFGLVIGAILAREVARHIRIDFGWLVAAAYAGWVPWCIGPSSSIPLAQASHGNPLNIVEKVTGQLLPFGDTIFTASSIVPTLIIVALIPVAFILAAPPSGGVVVAKFLDDVPITTRPEGTPALRGLVRRFEHSRICNLVLVAAGAAYFAISWSTGSFVFDISAVIFLFLMLGLALHPSPLAYLEAVQDGAKQTGGMMLQFPLYGGIMGIMTATGLAGVIAHFFVTMASAQTLPIWSYVSSLIISFLVPSAGGHWAVQGPFVVEAVVGLHASMAETAMAVAKGEAAANMVQPFWALPVVAMAGIGIQRVMGFMIVAFVVSAVVYAAQNSLVLIGSVDMMIVDSQVHIWAADTPDRPWPKETPAAPHDGPLSAAQLRVAMAEAGVDRAVLVPPSWEGTRNDLALAAAAEAPERFAVMGRLDITEPAAPDRISTWLAQPGMLGLRMNFWFDPLRSWLIDGRADWLFAALERHGIPMMVLATTVLPEMGRIAERHPGLRIVIDHLGMVLGNKGEPAFAEEANLLSLARLPNVAVKASVTPVSATDGYPYKSVHVHLRRAFDAFGPQRFFWGTDLTQLPCSYKQAVSMFTEELPWLAGPDLELVMGRALCTWLGWPE